MYAGTLAVWAARCVLHGPHMNNFKVAVFIALAACATDPDNVDDLGGSSGGGKTDGVLRDVGLRGESFGAYESMSVHVALGWGVPRTPAVAFASTTVEGGAFSVEFPSSINNEFDFTGYIDVDGDGSCGDGDVVWRDFYETAGSPTIVIVPDELWPGTEPIDPAADVYFCARFGG